MLHTNLAIEGGPPCTYRDQIHFGTPILIAYLMATSARGF